MPGLIKIRYARYPYKKRTFGHRHPKGRPSEDTEGDGNLQAQEGGLRKQPRPSLDLGRQLPEL